MKNEVDGSTHHPQPQPVCQQKAFSPRVILFARIVVLRVIVKIEQRSPHTYAHKFLRAYFIGRIKFPTLSILNTA